MPSQWEHTQLDPVQKPQRVASDSVNMHIVVGVVTDITRTDGIRPADPFVTEVLSTTNFVDELGTHFAFQLFHYLFASLHTRLAIQPRQGLALSIELALPLRESVVGHTLFSVGASRIALCASTLHALDLK